MARIFTSQLEKNVIFISGDEYRRFHPRFSDLIKQYGDEAVLHMAMAYNIQKLHCKIQAEKLNRHRIPVDNAA